MNLLYFQRITKIDPKITPKTLDYRAEPCYVCNMKILTSINPPTPPEPKELLWEEVIKKRGVYKISNRVNNVRFVTIPRSVGVLETLYINESQIEIANHENWRSSLCRFTRVEGEVLNIRIES